ncbi:MAG: shikimate kinase [Deltaproteobacteria bacterium]|nr:shikimate kinase [Deltaproteobacteria bacterium]
MARAGNDAEAALSRRQAAPAERPVLLVWGFMGTGKSAAGRIAARSAGVPFCDLDEELAATGGSSVADIFAEHGEVTFRRLERTALTRVLRARRPRVVALGGGTLLDDALRARALGRAFVVCLTATPAAILRRTAGSARPLLARGRGRRARIEALLAARSAAYAEAHAHIVTQGRPPEAVARELLACWQGWRRS